MSSRSDDESLVFSLVCGWPQKHVPDLVRNTVKIMQARFSVNKSVDESDDLFDAMRQEYSSSLKPEGVCGSHSKAWQQQQLE